MALNVQQGTSARRHVVTVAIILWLMWNAFQPAQAKTLTFAVIEVPPFGAAHAHHGPVGIYPDFLRAVSEEAGIPIKIVLVPFARAVSLVSSGAVDGTIMFETTGTEGRTVPLLALFETGLVVQSRPGLQLDSKADLIPRLIGRIRGGCQDLEKDTQARWRFYELDNQKQAVAMLKAGRIDAFCTVPEALAFAQGSIHGGDALYDSDQITISRKKVWILINPAVSRDVQAKLARAGKRVRDGGKLATILRSELGPTYSFAKPR